MEVLLLYWDELDDLYWAAAALRERACRMLRGFAVFLGLAAIASLGAMAANVQPAESLFLAGTLAVSLLLAQAQRP